MIYTDKTIKRKQDQKEKKHKILKIIFFPFFILIFLLVLYVGYMRFIKHETNISIFGFRQYMVVTGSMEPNYNIGDLIIIKETQKENIKVGDIINYISTNGIDTITHRVIEIEKKEGQIYYKTKGDNNNTEDPELINSDQVQGVLFFKISKIGAIITKMLTGTGIAILFVLILLSYLKDRNKEEKRVARENARKIYNVPKYEENDT